MRGWRAVRLVQGEGLGGWRDRVRDGEMRAVSSEDQAVGSERDRIRRAQRGWGGENCASFGVSGAVAGRGDVGKVLRRRGARRAVGSFGARLGRGRVRFFVYETVTMYWRFS